MADETPDGTETPNHLLGQLNKEGAVSLIVHLREQLEDAELWKTAAQARMANLGRAIETARSQRSMYKRAAIAGARAGKGELAMNFQDKNRLIKKASNLIDHSQGHAMITRVRELASGDIIAYLYLPATHRVEMEVTTLAELFELKALDKATTAIDWATARLLYEDWVDPDLYEAVSTMLEFPRVL